MPKELVNGIGLHWELAGRAGPAVVLIHGAWVDRHNWDGFVPYVQDSFRFLTYDRRGHGDSDRPTGQGRMRDDVDDLAGLLSHLDRASAYLVGNSHGGMVALRLAAEVPDACLGVVAHEPPFLHLDDRVSSDPRVERIDRLQRETIDRIASGDVDTGISGFLEAVIGPDAWTSAPEEFRHYLRGAAPSFVDDVNDPEPWTVNLGALGRFPGPVVLTQGELSAEFFGVIVDELARRLPRARRLTIAGAGHGPHVEQPEMYAAAATSAVSSAAL